jgi:hypothetical protein
MQDQLHKTEVRFTIERTMKAQRAVELLIHSFLTSVIDEVGRSTARPCRFTPGTFYKWVVGSHRLHGRMRKISL